MKKSKLLSVLTALSVMGSMLISAVPAKAAVQTATFTDDFSEEKVYERSSNIVYKDAYTDAELTTVYKHFATDTTTSVGDIGYITYKVDDEILGFTIDTTWNNYANIGIWKIALSADGENWTEYEAYKSNETAVITQTNDDGTTTKVTKSLEELQDPNIPDLSVSVDKSQVTLYNNATTKKSYYVMHFTPGAELAKGMYYLRITIPEVGPDRWVNAFARGIYNVSIDYLPGVKAVVENSGSVQQGEPIKVNFSKKMTEMPAPVVKTYNGIEIPVNYELSADGMSCTITPQNILEERKYTVEFTGGIAADGDEYGLNSIAEFTVVDLTPGDKTFTDDFGYSEGAGDLSKIYSTSADTRIITEDKGYLSTTLDLSTNEGKITGSYALDAGPKLEEPYIIYKVNGNITSFIVNTRLEQTYKHSNKFLYSVSADGSDWTELVQGTDFNMTSSTADAITLKNYTSVEGKIPEGVSYLKITYPKTNEDYITNDTGAGWNTRRILNVNIGYNIPGLPDYEVTNKSFTSDEAGIYTYSADFTSNKADVNVGMILAVYDANGLVRLSIDGKQVTTETPSAMTASVNAADVTNPEFKVFFWNSALVPLTDIILPETE